MQAGHIPLFTPIRARLEASSACQLLCPACPHATGTVAESYQGIGTLKLDDFRTFLANNPQVLVVELSNAGEILLNKALPAIMRHADQAGVLLTANNGVNLNTASADALESMVRGGLWSMTCSVDGVTQAVYEKYRVNGDVEAVLANIRLINEYKRKHRTLLPRLTWQFVVFKHNVHEIAAARQLARSLDMGFYLKESWDPALSPESWPAEETAGGAATVDADSWVMTTCASVFNVPQINFDGKVLGCCANYWGSFGSSQKFGALGDVVKDPAVREAATLLGGDTAARARHPLRYRTNQGRDPGLPCDTCGNYRHMQETDRWLTAARVAESEAVNLARLFKAASAASVRGPVILEVEQLLARRTRQIATASWSAGDDSEFVAAFTALRPQFVRELKRLATASR